MAKRSKKKTRSNRAGGAPVALPALSSLMDLPAFEELVCGASGREAEFAEACKRACDAAGSDISDELELGCIVRLDRGFPAVCCADGTYRAEFSARLTKGGLSRGENSRVAVGDWVCARRPHGHDMGLIEEILPRRSDIARWKGKARGEKQTLAANVDLVIVVQALGERPVSCERIARSAVIARDCGADVAVVLTKADRAGDEVLVSDIDAVREVLGDKSSLVVTSSLGAEGERARVSAVCAKKGVDFGIESVKAMVPEGRIAIVLGESGAGKSTLLNALLGHEALETGAVREADDMGRHTTVARRMVSLSGAGVIVDEPGLRRLPIVGHERGLAMVFPQIAAAARECRFRDCTHTHEPGCEVRARYEAGNGGFSKVRVSCYLALAAEMRESAASLDPDVVI